MVEQNFSLTDLNTLNFNNSITKVGNSIKAIFTVTTAIAATTTITDSTVVKTTIIIIIIKSIDFIIYYS